jgi:thiamine kinase-like enzyme
MDETTVRAICDLFGLGEPVGEATPVAGGLVHKMWRVETDGGIFAVKEMNRDVDDPGFTPWIERAFRLERAAFDAGVPMPRPVPVAGSSSCLGELPGSSGRPITVRVHAWVDGEKLDNARVYPPGVAAEVATMLAQIHALDMRSDVPARDALRVFGEAHWRTYAERAEANRDEWASTLRRLVPVIIDLEAYVAEAHDDPTPLLLTHRDADRKNVMRAPDGRLLLFDWDQAGPVNPRHDVANHALGWAGVLLGDPDREIARRFIEAYRCAGGDASPFRGSDLAEFISGRLGWLDLSVRRALGGRLRDASDQQYGAQVIHRYEEHLPRCARSLDAWLAALAD